MKWLLLLLILQFAMWDTSEEPPGTTEEELAEPGAHTAEKCEENRSQLESFKELMLKNKSSLKKEEEVQVIKLVSRAFRNCPLRASCAFRLGFRNTLGDSRK